MANWAIIREIISFRRELNMQGLLFYQDPPKKHPNRDAISCGYDRNYHFQYVSIRLIRPQRLITALGSTNRSYRTFSPPVLAPKPIPRVLIGANKSCRIGKTRQQI